MAILNNPNLAWDGRTDYYDGRALEKPARWKLEVTRVEDDPPPYIFHKSRGFNIDANHIRTKIGYSQDVEIPAGEHYLIVNAESHVTWGTDDYTVAWRVEIETEDNTFRTNNLWLKRVKGDQSYAVRVVVPGRTLARVRLIYWTKWAATNGSMNLYRIDMTTNNEDLPVRDTLDMTPGAAPPPPTEGTGEIEQPPPAEETPVGDLKAMFAELANEMIMSAALLTEDDDPEQLRACLRKLSRAFKDAERMIR